MSLKDNSVELINLTESIFGKENQIAEYALETTVYHTDNPSEYKPFLVVEFLGRKVIWVNPVQKKEGVLYSQRLRIDCQDIKNYDDYGYVMKFLSALCFLTDGPVIDIVSSSSGPFPGSQCIQETHITCLSGFEIDLLIKSVDWEKLSDNDWAELAFYRQAINSRSPYLAYLSFWKVIESHFKYNSTEMKNYINIELKKTSGFEKWKLKNKKDFSVRLFGARDKAAHALLGSKADKLQNPDNPEEYLEMQSDKEVISFLSAKAIQSCFNAR